MLKEMERIYLQENRKAKIPFAINNCKKVQSELTKRQKFVLSYC